MIKFEELLIKWNNGVRRGAQKKFAQKIGVKSNTISQWITFERPPDVDLRQRVAQKLGITVDELMQSFLEAQGVTTEIIHRKSPETPWLGETVVYEIHLNKEMAKTFDDVCKDEKRGVSAQMGVILEEWFARRHTPPAELKPGEYPKKEDVTGDTIIWPSKKHLLPGEKPHIKPAAPRTRGGH